MTWSTIPEGVEFIVHFASNCTVKGTVDKLFSKLQESAVTGSAGLCMPAQHIAKLDGSRPKTVRKLSSTCRQGCDSDMDEHIIRNSTGRPRPKLYLSSRKDLL